MQRSRIGAGGWGRASAPPPAFGGSVLGRCIGASGAPKGLLVIAATSGRATLRFAALPGPDHHKDAPTGPEGSRPCKALSPNLRPDEQREMLRQMLAIRRFEERASGDHLP
jgi:hypothetical protein